MVSSLGQDSILPGKSRPLLFLFLHRGPSAQACGPSARFYHTENRALRPDKKLHAPVHSSLHVCTCPRSSPDDNKRTGRKEEPGKGGGKREWGRGGGLSVLRCKIGNYSTTNRELNWQYPAGTTSKLDIVRTLKCQLFNGCHCKAQLIEIKRSVRCQFPINYPYNFPDLQRNIVLRAGNTFWNYPI